MAQSKSIRLGTSPLNMTLSTLLAIGYGAWLSSYPLMMFVLPDYGAAITIGLLCGLTLCGLQILLRPQDLPRSPIVWGYIGLFGLLILLSQLVGNFDKLDMQSVLQSGAMIALMIVMACVAAPSLYPRILPVYAVLVAMVLLYIYVNGWTLWGRLSAGAQPNFWGLMALSCMLAALSIETRLLKAFALGVAALIFYASNARGSMVGAFAGVMTAVGILLITLGARRRLVLIWIISFVALASFVAELSMGLISQELLRIDDPRRGIESGFTGRGLYWSYGLTRALERPFLGYGYREGDDLFGPALGIDSAHNGYISMMLDMGIIGLIAYLVFIGHAISAGFKRLRVPLSYCAMAYLVGYAVVSIFERYALNAGQPLSMLFLASAFYILRSGSQSSPSYPRRANTPSLVEATRSR